MLTLSVSGSVSDYSDTSNLRSSIASEAGVNVSYVSISVAAASVVITAKIAVPPSTTADAMQTTLSSSLDTPEKASAALGVTVEFLLIVVVKATPTGGDVTATPSQTPVGNGTNAALTDTSDGISDDTSDGGPPIAAIGGGAAVAVLLVVAAVAAGLYLHKKRKATSSHLVELTKTSEKAQKQDKEAVRITVSADEEGAVAKAQDKPEAASTTTVFEALAGIGLAEYDCFLTHDWGQDEDGRDNHARVARVCAALKAEGLRPWFDEDQMRGDINSKMVEGIEGSRSIVCFITKRYLQKAGGNGPSGANDNCKFEFDYGCRRKGVEKMISVVMERGCRNPNDWSGTVGGKLGGMLYVDLSSDGDGFGEGVKRLAAEILLIAPRKSCAQ